MPFMLCTYSYLHKKQTYTLPFVVEFPGNVFGIIWRWETETNKHEKRYRAEGSIKRTEAISTSLRYSALKID